jgi:putative oxidoreductase
MPPLTALAKHSDWGLLIMRLGVGAMFMTHGIPKLAKGPAGWEKLGHTMQLIGIDFAPTFWGLAAGITEAGGGLLLMLGLWTRAICIPLAFTMLMAAWRHLDQGDSLGVASHAIEAGFLFIGLVFVGPGRLSIDRR